MSLYPISWGRLSRALSYYTWKGFRYVEVPWYVPEEYALATRPVDLPPYTGDFRVAPGTLVASSEQSFLYLASTGKLPADSEYFVACSPCFRDCQPDDGLHQPHFMKVELWHTTKRDTSYHLLQTADNFFRKEGSKPSLEVTDLGLDLLVNGIEVGSYGFRSLGEIGWSYGTGVAEPRFSQALDG